MCCITAQPLNGIYRDNLMFDPNLKIKFHVTGTVKYLPKELSINTNIHIMNENFKIQPLRS